MTDLKSVRAINEELARKINLETRANPQSPYAGKFVGIANGRVVVVTDDLDELARKLEQVEPDPMKTFCVEASRDYTEVHEIWSPL